MTMYCTCGTCKRSLAKPNRGVQAGMEEIDGLFVMMEPGWTLAHWSPRIFQDLYSTEIHHFAYLGGKPVVGASFYLFNGPAPKAVPRQLGNLGIGGNCLYVIDDWELGNQLNAFYKFAVVPAKEGWNSYREVAVALGCGGFIRFDGNRRGVSYYYTGTPPTMK